MCSKQGTVLELCVSGDHCAPGRSDLGFDVKKLFYPLWLHLFNLNRVCSWFCACSERINLGQSWNNPVNNYALALKCLTVCSSAYLETNCNNKMFGDLRVLETKAAF